CTITPGLNQFWVTHCQSQGRGGPLKISGSYTGYSGQKNQDRGDISFHDAITLVHYFFIFQ
ncbi:hypothetical protein, partial [uncultured Duncaniella sp.]|uniref:hypothetical protein n=1 Tax=uncultured Duncaniella sp. TaxID=2768039 RepID=UPI00272FCC39